LLKGIGGELTCRRLEVGVARPCVRRDRAERGYAGVDDPAYDHVEVAEQAVTASDDGGIGGWELFDLGTQSARHRGGVPAENGEDTTGIL